MPAPNSQKRICKQCRMVTTPGGLGNHQKATGHMGIIVVGKGIDSEVPPNITEIIDAAVDIAVADQKVEWDRTSEQYQSLVSQLTLDLDESRSHAKLYGRSLIFTIAVYVISVIVLLFVW